jgi:uncharacterized membrane protein YfcA
LAHPPVAGHNYAMTYVIAAMIGLVGGVTSGLFGVGGGIVMVPAMVFLLEVEIKRAIGTSLGVIIPTALVGTWKHHTKGFVDWTLVLMLAPLAVLGSYWGARLMHGIPDVHLKRVFGVLLILAGSRLLLARG